MSEKISVEIGLDCSQHTLLKQDVAYSYKKMIIFQPRKDSVNTGCYFQVGFVTSPVERVGVRRE